MGPKERSALREGRGLQRGSARGSFSEREGDLERVGPRGGPGLGAVVRGLGRSRAELLFLDPCPGQAGVALWFLKSISPSLPTSGSPGLARIWKRFVEWGE